MSDHLAGPCKYFLSLPHIPIATKTVEIIKKYFFPIKKKKKTRRHDVPYIVLEKTTYPIQETHLFSKKLLFQSTQGPPDYNLFY